MKEDIARWIQSEYHYEDTAKLVLRFTVGFLMLFHGINKVTHGISFIEGKFSNIGLPEIMAYSVYLGEIIAPMMLIIGFRVKMASLLIIMTMVVAVGLTHAGDIFSLGKHGEWAIELQMFYVLASLAVLLQGAGKYSVDNYSKTH